jgi:hypothetical protein
MRSLALVLPIVLAGCLNHLATSGDGGTDGASSSSAGPDGGFGTAATGVSCGEDLQTGIVLCRGISTCPNLLVGSDQFPDCGFRIHGDALDLECLCSGALCPIGAPATCDQARQLLSSQTEFGVCQQVNDGRCLDLNATRDAGANGCDKTCAAQCGGDPSCIKLCGC